MRPARTRGRAVSIEVRSSVVFETSEAYELLMRPSTCGSYPHEPCPFERKNTLLQSPRARQRHCPRAIDRFTAAGSIRVIQSAEASLTDRTAQSARSDHRLSG